VPGVTGWPALPHDARGFRIRTGGHRDDDRAERPFNHDNAWLGECDAELELAAGFRLEEEELEADPGPDA